MNAKCKGHGCLIRESCRRYLAPAGREQKWILTMYAPSNMRGCPNYIKTRVEPVIRPTTRLCSDCGGEYLLNKMTMWDGIYRCPDCAVRHANTIAPVTEY